MNNELNRRIHGAMGGALELSLTERNMIYDRTHGIFGTDPDAYAREIEAAVNNLIPDYCGSISDAFELVEWMRKEKGTYKFLCEQFREKWSASFAFVDAEGVHQFYGDDESLPMAISLAAIEVLGSKRGE